MIILLETYTNLPYYHQQSIMYLQNFFVERNNSYVIQEGKTYTWVHQEKSGNSIGKIKFMKSSSDLGSIWFLRQSIGPIQDIVEMLDFSIPARLSYRNR